MSNEYESISSTSNMDFTMKIETSSGEKYIIKILNNKTGADYVEIRKGDGSVVLKGCRRINKASFDQFIQRNIIESLDWYMYAPSRFNERLYQKQTNAQITGNALKRTNMRLKKERE